MKLTNIQLKRIIKEELEKVMNETEMGGVRNVNPIKYSQTSPSDMPVMDMALEAALEKIAISAKGQGLYMNEMSGIGVELEQVAALSDLGKVDIDNDYVTVIGTDQI